MSDVRVYLPLDRAGLDTLADRGELVAERAFGVTDDLREAYAEEGAGDEELEYAALMAAAGPFEGQHRIVAAVDVPAAQVGPLGGESPGAVGLAEPVTLSQVASFHVDLEGPDGSLVDDDLAWFATQEVDDLRALLDR